LYEVLERSTFLSLFFYTGKLKVEYGPADTMLIPRQNQLRGEELGKKGSSVWVLYSVLGFIEIGNWNVGHDCQLIPVTGYNF